MGIEDIDIAEYSVKADGNSIYFYGEITEDSILDFSMKLNSISIELECDKIKKGYSEKPPIYIYISSPGGDLFAGFSVYDRMMSCDARLVTVIDGMCASTATLMFLAGDERLVRPHSFMLIHQISSMISGTHEQTKDNIAVNEICMKKLEKIYESRSRLKSDEIKEMLKRETWIESADCLKYGLATGVI